MNLIVEATYENGVLRPAEPLPLKEHETVRITIQSAVGWVQESYGLCRWTGDPEELRRLAVAPDPDGDEAP